MFACFIIKVDKEKKLTEKKEIVESDDDNIEDDDEEGLPMESRKQRFESIGPPKILQFKPEVKEVPEIAASPAFSIPREAIENVSQFMQGFNVHVRGGEICEFCEDMTKPWPTILEQEEFGPEEV